MTDLSISGVNGWSIVDYDSMDVASEKVNAKRVAMMINGDKTTGADAISFTSANYPRMDGANASSSDELPITYSAKVPAQSAVMSGVTIANVIFVVGWDQ